ncbi:hypothetical protein EPA93_24890 [Ktedonosporobacter rubrisoli]|uniref:DUF5666 domain-containing protein n=1 Tax=Ktedonosporobacter rubrisoli TaxID=2509675 RepID=A0A4P6JUL6_KTERU|nr:DUF5666 domain-containing protein [Ktedonosporobacter rubrisoli]QBD79045.1 hypothetical protein EPA93_24890 [Ktedonosporobacter rubrisoli]
MGHTLSRRASLLAMCIGSLFLLALFAGCAGVPTTTGANGTTATLSGSVQAVNPSSNSVVLNVNGQQITVGGLDAQQLSALQSQQGKQFTLQVTQNGNAYTIVSNSTPQEGGSASSSISSSTSSDVSSTSNTNGTNEPGKLSFIGKIQSANASNIVVLMPNGDTLTMNRTAQSDLSDLNNQVTQGQQVKVKALANPDGSFMLQKLDTTDPQDLQDPNKLNRVDINGITTSAVGTDNVIHFKVGNKSYSATINANTELNNLPNAQAIAANQPVKVELLFNGANATVLQVEYSND